jgi:hypothetical protein
MTADLEPYFRWRGRRLRFYIAPPTAIDQGVQLSAEL